MITASILLVLVVQTDAQCYSIKCGPGDVGVGGAGGYGVPSPSYVQSFQPPIPPQPLPHQLPQPQSAGYYYKMGTYAQPPTEVLPSATKEFATVSLPTKSTEYDGYEKKHNEVKSSSPEGTAAVYENPIKPSSTYIREVAYHPYPQRPMPYRSHQTLPPGCPVVQPQYYRLASYMPREHMLPNAPTPAYPVAPLFGTLQPPQPVVQLPTYHHAPLNDCCGRCSAICGPHSRRIFAKSAKTFSSSESNMTTAINDKFLNDSRCTSKQLKEIMEKISYRTPSLAKRLIQGMAEKNIKGFVSVFCSKDDFSYVSRSEAYCQTENNGILCYAFQHN